MNLTHLKDSAKQLGLLTPANQWFNKTKPDAWQKRAFAYSQTKGKCRLVMVSVLLKPLSQSLVDLTDSLIDLNNTALVLQAAERFRTTFTEENLNLSALSQNAQNHYAKQLLANGNLENCLEDMTVMTLQQLAPKALGTGDRHAINLALLWMQDYCQSSWDFEGANCAVKYEVGDPTAVPAQTK